MSRPTFLFRQGKKQKNKILSGAIYLRNQLERFADYGKYAVIDAVAAYNAGPQAMINAGDVTNYSETRQYVVNVANLRWNSLMEGTKNVVVEENSNIIVHDRSFGELYGNAPDKSQHRVGYRGFR